MEAKRQAKFNVYTLDDDIIMMPGADNTDPDNHDSHEDQLWNEKSLKNYVLDALNMLESSYSTSLKLHQLYSLILFTKSLPITMRILMTQILNLEKPHSLPKG